MADDIVNPRGTISAYKNEGQKSGNDAPFPVIGVVKDNVDDSKTGRIRVYIADFGAPNPDVDSSWQTVDYLSPFYGRTDTSGANTGYGDYTANPHSYGFWATAPDIGTKVLCIFPNGKKDFGYYIGCIPETNKTHMVPAIAATKEVTVSSDEGKRYGGATRLPVTEINVNNEGVNNSPTAQSAARPVHSYQAGLLFQQGLLRDPVRGAISSSSVRETPSRVFGMSTPGRPIYKGGFDDTTIASAKKSEAEKQKVIGRRGGHSFVMDDGDLTGANQLVRIRTALGHQITMSDDGQTLFIIHSNGQSYIELGKEGTVDIFSTNSFNVRTQGDINFHADNNVNIHAKKNFNVYAESINMESEKNTNHRVGGDYKIFVKGKLTALSEGAMGLTSSGELGIECHGTTFINGSKINLNTGSPGVSGQVVNPMDKVAQTDTLWDKEKGWLASPGKLNTIATRAPAHMPWVNSNQGVDVKTSSNADEALPAPTTSESAAAGSASAGASPETPVTPAAVATVPTPDAVGGNIDPTTAAAAVSQTAATMATGAAASAVAAGGGIIPNSGGLGLTAVVGKLGLVPSQLSQAGVLKPGSEAIITKAINSGKSLAEAIPKQLFTGSNGVTDLPSFVNNPSAQVGAQVNLMQQGFNGLVKNGTISGKESATSITGLVSAAATAGVKAVTDFAKNAAGAAQGALNNLTAGLASGASGALSSVKNLVAGGNFASGLTQQVNGALGGLGLKGDSASGLKDMVSSAFDKIKSALPELPAGKPINLAQKAAEAEKAAEDKESASGSGEEGKGLLSSLTAGAQSAASGLTSGLSSATSGLSGVLDNAVSAGKSALGVTGDSQLSAKGLLDKGLSVATSATKSLQTAVASVSSGIKGLVGGTGGMGNVVDKATAAVNNVPGLNNVSSPGALGSLTSLADKALGSITGGKAGLQNGSLMSANGLLALASSGLAGKQVAQLASMIKSMPGGSGIKAPTVALNTMNRDSINGAVSGVLGKGVPAPNFSGTAQQPNLEKEKKLTELQQQLADIEQKIKDNDAEFKKAYAELLALQSQIKEVSQEEYEAQGLGQKFKDKKAEGYKIINAGADLALERSKINEQITDTQYGSTSQLALTSLLLSRRG